MATVKLPYQNPHVSLVNDEVLDVNYRNKNFKITISNITKIYLSKRKTGYLSALIGNLLVSRNTGFKLYIHTKDSSTLTLDVTTNDKFFFVSLITWVRKQLKEAASAPPTRITRPTEVRAINTATAA